MNVLVFEWLTGGGLLIEGLNPDAACPFQQQGRAMLEALVDDFCSLTDVNCIVPVDHRQSPRLPALANAIATSSSDLEEQLKQISNDADYVVLIAPECPVHFPDAGVQPCLLQLLRWLEADCGKLISPDSTFVEVASDKTRTMDLLRASGIPVPEGCRLDHVGTLWNPAMESGPIVLKPNFGAGSEGVQKIATTRQPVFTVPSNNASDWRVEKFCEGIPVSCSAICDREEIHCLPPMYQQFNGTPFGTFEFSRPIDDPNLAMRIQTLAERAIRAMPETRGYVGVDLIAGDTSDEDVVIEINPRLTTSYIDIRQCVPANVAAMMLPQVIA
ncbi:MAG: ATP-grasp domain-containing protein [Planctomycetota bacterium]